MIYSVICAMVFVNVVIFHLLSAVLVFYRPNWLLGHKLRLFGDIQHATFASILLTFLAFYEAQESHMSRMCN